MPGFLARVLGRITLVTRDAVADAMPSGVRPLPSLESVEAHYARSPFVREICVLDTDPSGTPSDRGLHALVVPDLDRLRERRIVNVRDLLRFELETWSVTLPAARRVQGFDVVLDRLPRSEDGTLLRDEAGRAWRERSRTAAGRAAPTGESVAAVDALTRAVLGAVQARSTGMAVTTSSHLDLDVQLDSMSRAELLLELEAALACTIDPDAASRVATVADLIEALRAAGARPGAPGADGDVWQRQLDAPLDGDLHIEELRKPKWLLVTLAFIALKLLAAACWLVIGLRVRGARELPSGGPCLICPNHQSFVDGFLVCTALPYRTVRSLFLLGAPEYFSTPATARAARAINLVPVDPDANLVGALRVGAAGLRLGRTLVIFPEGERSIDGELKPFRRGGALLASRLHVPMVPVALDGAFDLWPRGRGIAWRLLLPFSGHRVRVAFGTPLLPGVAGVPVDDAALAGHLRDRVAELVSGLRADE